MSCVCGSGQLYAHCCEPLHRGRPAASAEALMRSRFSAFVLGLEAYLLDSWAAQTRPAEIGLARQPQWKRLEVLSRQEDAQGDRAQVRFRAIGLDGGQWLVLEETSEFVRQPPHWRYLQGDSHYQRLSPGRNDPCPCGGGRKLKKCCGG